MSQRKVLIVDDEESIRNQLKWGLADDYEVLTAASADEARRLLRSEKPAVVTLDVALKTPGAPPEEGLILLDEIVESYPMAKVIMVTGNDSRDNALLAIRRGAIDWYSKPIQLDELRVILQRAFHIREIELAQKTEPARGRKRYHKLIGESEKIQRVFDLVQRVAPTDATVLILGENGTGKELVAHAMHSASARRDGPFVPINCSAIPETLLESELFGHERGAFTDAHRAREGKFEIASGGTVFLDEIGELPPQLQVKLLRFLQDRIIERVGGRESHKVDVRVLAATNRNLQLAMDEGAFREDLYYRLCVVTIKVPPLRDRGDDLRLLAEFFLDEFAKQHRRRIRGFTQAALRAIQSHPWPGNVRELENRIQRGVILCQDSYLRPEDMELAEAEAGPARSLQDARDTAERQLLIDSLTRNAGNITRAAKDVAVSRPTMHDLLKKHEIDVEGYRRPEAPEDEEAAAASADDDGPVEGEEAPGA